MKKKIVIFCSLVVITLVALPVVSSYTIVTEPLGIENTTIEKESSIINEHQVAPLFNGYLLFYIVTFTPGSGFHPYPGANITVKGFSYSYNGTTDEMGNCLIKVHTNLFRAKFYFVKVTIQPQDRVLTRRDTVLIQPRQIVYREFLFIVL